jgi:NAD(P)-dependent dehydrogenase (short-subunit alcohol dehydrogenase family)
MPDKPVALVTGANQGIGLQIAKDLVPHGVTVLIGSRNFENGQTAAKSIGADAHAVQLDVTDHKSIAAAAELVYPASKTTLSALTVAMALELEPEGIKVNAVSPGYTKTNLNGYSGTETVEEGAREAVRVALLGPDGPTGKFTRWEN